MTLSATNASVAWKNLAKQKPFEKKNTPFQSPSNACHLRRTPLPPPPADRTFVLRCRPFGRVSDPTPSYQPYSSILKGPRFACVHDLVFAEVPGSLVNPLGKSCGVGAEVSSDGLLKWLRYRPEHDVKMLTCMFFLILHD